MKDITTYVPCVNAMFTYHCQTVKYISGGTKTLGDPCEWNGQCAVAFSECKPEYHGADDAYACRCFKNYIKIGDICVPSEYLVH